MTEACFVCPQCRRRSYNREDIRFGYCGGCHEFTGDQHGHNGHSSSSLEEGRKGEVFMQQNDKDQNAQQSMQKVSRNGDRDSVREMCRERMEPGQQQAVHELRGSGIPVILPRPYRYYAGALACGMAGGISWTIALIGPTSLSRHISRAHALQILYGAVAALLAYQTVYLILEGRRLRRQSAELKDYCERNGLPLP